MPILLRRRVPRSWREFARIADRARWAVGRQWDRVCETAAALQAYECLRYAEILRL